MKNNKSQKLNATVVNGRLGMCAAALAGTAAAVPSADAVIITNNTPFSIPATFAGIYLNFQTGVAGITPAGSPGWDFNPYAAGGGNLSFFWNTGAGGVGSGTTYTDLTLGTVVSAGSTFITTPGVGPSFLTTGTHILGFRFLNEATGATNFGYLRLSVNGPTGFPATITGYSYENNGGAITVAPVPEPATTALLAIAALVLGAAGVRQWRRQEAA